MIHLALLVVAITGVRACGGATQAEDRLSVWTRWTAEKMGFGAVMRTWDTTLRPPIASVTTQISNGVYEVVSRTLDATESAADSAVTWAADTIKDAMTAVARNMRATVTPQRKDEPADKSLEDPAAKPSQVDSGRSRP